MAFTKVAGVTASGGDESSRGTSSLPLFLSRKLAWPGSDPGYTNIEQGRENGTEPDLQAVLSRTVTLCGAHGQPCGSLI